MSKTYRCRVKKELREVHRARDQVHYRGLGLLDVLDPQDMEDVYRQALKDMGASEKSDGSLSLRVGEATVRVDPKQRTAEVSVSEDKEVRTKVDREEKIFEWSESREKAQKKAEEKVDREAGGELEKKKKDHDEEVRSKLDQVEDRVKEQLRRAANEAHKAALRRKAGRMGTVTVDKEDELANGDRRLTLEVELT